MTLDKKKKYAIEVCWLRSFEDDYTFTPILFQLEFKRRGYHAPGFNFLLVLFGYTMIDVSLYNRNHLGEDEQ